MKKIMIHILGTIIIFAIGAFLFVTGLESQGILREYMSILFGHRGVMIGLFCFCMLLYIDAMKRQVPYSFLLFFAMLVLSIIIAPLYLIMRPSIPESLSPKLCPHCNKYYEPPVTFCPHCGTRL